jgi:hypothetical protein
VVRSEAGIVAVNCVDWIALGVMGAACPPGSVKRTVAPAAKFVPAIVTVTAEPLTAAMLGVTEVREGNGVAQAVKRPCELVGDVDWVMIEGDELVTNPG